MSENLETLKIYLMTLNASELVALRHESIKNNDMPVKFLIDVVLKEKFVRKDE